MVLGAGYVRAERGVSYYATVLQDDSYLHTRVFQKVCMVFNAALADLSLYSDEGRQIAFAANAIELAPQMRDQLAPDAIIVQLEAWNSPWLRNPAYLELLQRHAVLDYDAQNVERLRARGVDARWCPIRYHPILTRLRPVEPEFDVLFFGGNTPRREVVLKAIENWGLDCHFVGHQHWNDEALDRAIERCRIVVNIHAYDDAPLELCRLSYLLSNRICILSEGPIETGFHSMMAFAEHGDLAQQAYVMCSAWDDKGRRNLAQAGFDGYRALPWQAEVLKGVLA